MSRILPGERAPCELYGGYGEPLTTWPAQIRYGSIMRPGSNIYIRDNPMFPANICISKFSPKAMREINRQLRHARQLTHKSHMIIATSATCSFKTLSDNDLNTFLSRISISTTCGISTYSRDWTHPDLPGVAIVETTRRVYGHPPVRGPTFLFFPGRLDMMHLITTIAPIWLSNVSESAKLVLPDELVNIVLDFIPAKTFDDWLVSQAP